MRCYEQMTDKNMNIFIDSSALQEMIEEKGAGKELLIKLKSLKDSGAIIHVQTTPAQLFGAIFFADSKCSIQNIQKILSIVEMYCGDYTSKDALHNQVINIMKLVDTLQKDKENT